MQIRKQKVLKKLSKKQKEEGKFKFDYNKKNKIDAKSVKKKSVIF